MSIVFRSRVFNRSSRHGSAGCSAGSRGCSTCSCCWRTGGGSGRCGCGSTCGYRRPDCGRATSSAAWWGVSGAIVEDVHESTVSSTWLRDVPVTGPGAFTGAFWVVVDVWWWGVSLQNICQSQGFSGDEQSLITCLPTFPMILCSCKDKVVPKPGLRTQPHSRSFSQVGILGE